MDDQAYSISDARYARGQKAIRCPSTTGYKTRAARLIGDGLNCRWTGRERAYIASPSKVAKFEALYAAGFDASSFSGKLWHPEWRLDDLTPAEAMQALKRMQREALVVAQPHRLTVPTGNAGSMAAVSVPAGTRVAPAELPGTFAVADDDWLRREIRPIYHDLIRAAVRFTGDQVAQAGRAAA
jgi:hypothetical protein